MYYSIFAQEYLEKLASAKKDDFVHLDPKAQQERELIRRIQENNDFMAMNQLIMEYRGVINNCVRGSGLTSVMDYDTAFAEGVKAFKEIVKNNFDLNNKEARPATYITSALTRQLQKVSNNVSDFGARKSEDLQMKSKSKAIAESFLQRQLGRKPTIDETFNFIQKKMKTGKGITRENLERLNLYDIKELSGSQIVGAGNAPDGAETLTFDDITNVKKKTPAEIMEEQMQQQMIENHLKKFTLDKREKRLIMNMYGIGQFKNNKAKSINEAAINAGMTNYEARKVLDRFVKSLEQHGII
ncbi:MAG: hypothetical protein N2749_00780 [Clostridia bacterium]|nr:hypothetical protein [Clostridia bacterium]